MALDDFKTDSKTSSPTDSSGPTTNGIEKFIEESKEDEVDIEGGFSIPKTSDEKHDTEVVKIFGGPGTGKTTTMVGNTDIEEFKGILQRMFEEGRAKETMLIAYTSAARYEAVERIQNLMGISEAKAKERIVTIHSLAMRFNNLQPKDIVEIRYANDKYNFCQDVGLEYDFYASSDDDEMLSEPDDEGHLFFKINSWLKSSLKPPAEYQDCPAASHWNRSDEDFVELVNEWEEYKNQERIWEFDDAILESVNNEDKVDAVNLFVDEVQDLYPLQQAFLDNQFGHVKRIWLAGDDDQTIYEWAGAEPQYFLDMKGKMHERDDKFWQDKTGYWDSEGVYILDQSWRMPEEILHLSQMCIEKVDVRQDKKLKPHHEGGEFIALRNPRSNRVIDLINHDDTMMLFRAKYQMSNFGQELIDAGIPFEDRFNTWNEDIVALRDGLAAIKNENSRMTGGQASQIMTEMPDDALERGVNRQKASKIFSNQQTVHTSDVVDKIRFGWPETSTQFGQWTQEFEEANWYQQNAVRNNLMLDKEDMEPEGLRLNTIHGSKGREADTVILSLSSTQSVMENMPPDRISDPERRLYYVGMTRTKNKLVMVEQMDSDSPTLTMDQLLGPEWREYHEYANVTVDRRM